MAKIQLYKALLDLSRLTLSVLNTYIWFPFNYSTLIVPLTSFSISIENYSFFGFLRKIAISPNLNKYGSAKYPLCRIMITSPIQWL